MKKVMLPNRYNVIEMYAKDGGYLTSNYLGKLCYFKDAENIINDLKETLLETRRELSKLKKAHKKCLNVKKIDT